MELIFILAFRFVHWDTWGEKKFPTLAECEAYRYELSQQKLYEITSCVEERGA